MGGGQYNPVTVTFNAGMPGVNSFAMSAFEYICGNTYDTMYPALNGIDSCYWEYTYENNSTMNCYFFHSSNSENAKFEIYIPSYDTAIDYIKIYGITYNYGDQANISSDTTINHLIITWPALTGSGFIVSWIHDSGLIFNTSIHISQTN